MLEEKECSRSRLNDLQQPSFIRRTKRDEVLGYV